MEYFVVGRKDKKKAAGKNERDEALVLRSLETDAKEISVSIAAPAEKRRTRRIPVQLSVNEKQSVIDLSDKGAFVIGNRSPLNSAIELTLSLPNTPDPIRVTGTVVRSVFHSGSFGQAKNKVEGMGILFSNLSQEAEAQILNFLETASG